MGQFSVEIRPQVGQFLMKLNTFTSAVRIRAGIARLAGVGSSASVIDDWRFGAPACGVRRLGKRIPRNRYGEFAYECVQSRRCTLVA